MSLPEGLTPKMQKFVQLIVAGEKQLRAYQQAYDTKASDEVAKVDACRLFKRFPVQAYYRQLMNQSEADAIMTRAEAMTILSRMSRARLADLVTTDGEVRSEMFDQSGQEVAKLKVTRKETHHEDGGVTYTKSTEVALRDPNKSLKELAEMEGWKEDKGIGGDVHFHLDLGADDDE